VSACHCILSTFPNFAWAFFIEIPTLFLTLVGSSPSPKRIRGTVEEEIGDDTTKGQSVPTLGVDPSSGTAEAAPERSPPLADHSLRVIVAVALLGQTQPSIGEPTMMSTLGTRPVPRVLKKKVLSIKKSTL
jgi:hypothetical protein